MAREEKKKIYYLDETWLNEGHTTTNVWTDTNVKNKRDAFLDGLTTGLKNPSGKFFNIIPLLKLSLSLMQFFEKV